MADKPVCKIDGCDKAAKARGWCGAHYERQRKNGSFPKSTDWGAAQEFIKMAAIHTDQDECLLWPFAKNSAGYAGVRVRGVTKKAHRIICEMAHGAPHASDMDAAHSCGNSSCVNPAHLRWASRIENNRDKAIHGKQPAGETVNFAKITESDALEIFRLKGVLSQPVIAEKFGITQGAVSRIHTKDTWKHLHSRSG